MSWIVSMSVYMVLVIVPTIIVTYVLGVRTATIIEIQAGVAAITVVVASIILLMQRFLPVFSEDWRDFKHDVPVDLLHGIVSTGAGKAMADALVIGVVLVVARVYPSPIGGWFSGVSIGAQVIAGMCIGELGTYWAHRALHRSPRWWPIHAVHHSPERMGPLSAGRTHPLNTMIAWMSQSVLLVLLGVDSAAVVGIAMFTSLNGLVQHSNMDMRLGWVEWVIAGPNFHRWHHSQNPVHYRRNLASNLSFFDLIFGTFYLPRGVRPDEKVGVPDAQVTRGSNPFVQFFWHLLTPLFYWRWVAERRQKENDG